MITMADTSVAEVYRVIKQFHFYPDVGHDSFSELSYSDDDLIGLTRDGYQVQLKRQSTGLYPTADDIWFRTWVTNPKSCRKLLMLEVFPEIQVDGGEIQVRIYDGTNDLFWDGSDWVIAAVDDWNSEAEINANIETYPILPDREFAITVNLKSVASLLYDAGEITPFVNEIRVLMEVHIDFLEDIILRSMMPSIAESITGVANYAAMPSPTADTLTLDFDSLRVNTPYTIIGIERVYDLTDDPELLYNLYSSYSSVTGLITLTEAFPSGHRPLIVFRYRPALSYITHQDYLEVNKLPHLIIQRVEIPVASSYNVMSKEGIVDKGTYDAVVLDDPMRISIEFRIHGLTASAVDEIRLMSKVLQYFKENQFITSVGLDENYRMYLEKEFRDLSNPNRSDERAFWTKFIIQDIRLPFIATDTKAVKELNIGFSEPVPPHNDPIKGGSRIISYVHSGDMAVEWTEDLTITE
jgi:hypothetical protein